MGGVIISEREAIKRRRNVKQIAMVDLEDNLVLDASINPNELRYINHCCEPNSYIRVTKNRVEFYSLRKIKVGEELSADYGETHHHGTLPCRCGAKNAEALSESPIFRLKNIFFFNSRIFNSLFSPHVLQ